MKTIKREFVGDTVPLDFHEYVQCTFRNCLIVYHGYSNFHLTDCRFENCKVKLAGPAGMGLGFLSVFKNRDDAGSKDLADQILRAAKLL